MLAPPAPLVRVSLVKVAPGCTKAAAVLSRRWLAMRLAGNLLFDQRQDKRPSSVLFSALLSCRASLAWAFADAAGAPDLEKSDRNRTQPRKPRHSCAFSRCQSLKVRAGEKRERRTPAWSLARDHAGVRAPFRGAFSQLFDPGGLCAWVGLRVLPVRPSVRAFEPAAFSRGSHPWFMLWIAQAFRK